MLLKLQSPKTPMYRAQTKFAVRASRFVRRGDSICKELSSLPGQVRNSCVSGSIFSNLAGREMSEPSPACGVKKPFPEYRPDRAGWPPIFIAFYTLAECAFLTLLPKTKKKQQQKKQKTWRKCGACLALPPSDFTSEEIRVKHRNGAVETNLVLGVGRGTRVILRG